MISVLLELPITTARERELRRACRGAMVLTLVTVAYGVYRAPNAPDGSMDLLPFMWPSVVALVLCALLESWLHLAHRAAWRALKSDGFCRCPGCELSLIQSAGGGTCTCAECKRRFESEQLRATWQEVYRRHLRSTKPMYLALPRDCDLPPRKKAA